MLLPVIPMFQSTVVTLQLCTLKLALGNFLSLLYNLVDVASTFANPSHNPQETVALKEYKFGFILRCTKLQCHGLNAIV